MLTKSHQDAHLETIKRCGLTAWQRGWAAAMEAGKQNVLNYVTRCAESAMLEAQAPRRTNGNGKSQPPQAGYAIRYTDEGAFLPDGSRVE